jgi:hypothetical protein
MSKEPDTYTKEETKRRMEAALRGARIAGAKHKTSPKKVAKKVRKRSPA